MATVPERRVGLHRVPVLDEQAPLDPAEVEAGRRRGVGADRGPQVEQPDAVLPGRPGRQEREGIGLEAGGDDRLDEPAGDAEPLGGRAVDRPVQPDDPAEGADGVALVGQLERLGQGRRPSAAPQGLLCLRIVAAGSAKRRISRRALSRSSRLLYESSLPCRIAGGRQVRARSCPARRRRPPAGAGSRRSGGPPAARSAGSKRGRERLRSAIRRPRPSRGNRRSPGRSGPSARRPPGPATGGRRGSSRRGVCSCSIRPGYWSGEVSDGDVGVVLGRPPDQARAADVDVLDRLLEGRRRAGRRSPRTGRGSRRPGRSARSPGPRAAARSSGTSRRARMPPWSLGWSVLTRPPRISGWPV